MTDFSKMELTGLPTSFFEVNRKKFFELAPQKIPDFNKNTVIVLLGGVETPKYDTDGSYYYFYQEANFYYLTGVTEAGLLGTSDFSDNSLTLFYEEPEDSTQIWQTIQTMDEIAKKYNLKVEKKVDLNKWLKTRNPDIITRLEGTSDTTTMKLAMIEFDFSGEYADLSKKIVSIPLYYDVLKDCRKVKTPEEIELMTFICNTSVEAHIAMIKGIKPDLWERDIENIFNTYCTDKYYTRIWGYPCIGGCGTNGATLHYDINNKKCLDGELFLADMGMRFCNYVSDVTIIVPVNGKFTKKQKEIYDIVLSTNRAIIDITKPGVSMLDTDKMSKKLIIEGLQKLGLINSGFSVDQMYDDRAWYYFMPHGLGHHVGIEVHDVNFISYEGDKGSKSKVLKEGNVITVEPGIYFRDFLLELGFKDEKVKKYLNEELIRTYFDFGGVRIEDDILITKDGNINMTASLPRKTEEIEKLMSEK